MSMVKFTQLTLKGFGKYRDSVTVNFTPLLNLLLASNESGKSTLAAGLVAVIFGLPASSDASSYGTSKYRNWDGALDFSGEVYFRRDNLLYHIVRDFESQSIRIRIQLEEGKWQDLVRGVHNPRATKPNVAYLDFLQLNFGMRSADLFFQTFFLEQPLPASGTLSLELQQLLSGGEHFKVVAERLKSELKNITRYANRHYEGVNAGRKDQRLEELAARRKALQNDIATNSGLADGLQQVTLQLSQTEAEYLLAGEQAKKASRVKEAFDRWSMLRDRCALSREKRSDAERAVKHVDALEAEVSFLQENYTSGQAFDAEKQALEQAQSRLSQFSDLTALGEQPLDVAESVRLWSDNKREQYRQLAHLRHGYAEGLADLKTSFGVLEQADPAGIEKLKNFATTKAKLAIEIAAAEEDLQQGQVKRARVDLLRKDIEDQFVDPDKLLPDVPDSLDRAAQLKERLLSLEDNGGDRSRRSKEASSPVWPMALGAISGLALYVWWGRHAGLVGIVLALGLLAVGLLAKSRARDRGFMSAPPKDSKEKADIKAALAECEFHVPAIANLPLSQVAAVAMKIRQYEELRSNLSAELAQVKTRLEIARAAQQKWLVEAGPFIDGLAEPETAYEVWKKRREQVEKLGERAEQLESMLGTSLPVARLPGLTGRMLPYFALMGIDATSGEELYEALDSFSKDSWQQLELRVHQYLEGQREVASASEYFRHKKADSENQLKNRVAAFEEALRANGVSSLKELQARQEDAADTYYICSREWREHIEQHPGLPGMDEARDTSTVFALYEEVKRRAIEATDLAKELEDSIRKLSLNHSRLEGKQLISLAAAEEELQELKIREESLHREAQALGIAATELDLAIREFQETYRDRLAASVSEHFSLITGCSRQVNIGDDFYLRVAESDGQSVEIGQLSQGAKDQLYLALRLGVADLTSDNVRLPLILDDPFLTSDDERLERIRKALHSLDRQVILLSHSPRFNSWGEET